MEGLLHEDIKQQELFQLTCCFGAIYYFHILCTVLLNNSSDILSTFQELTLVIEVAVLQFVRPWLSNLVNLHGHVGYKQHHSSCYTSADAVLWFLPKAALEAARQTKDGKDEEIATLQKEVEVLLLISLITLF